VSLDKSKVPHGSYCYTATGRQAIHNQMFRDGKLVSAGGYYIMPEWKRCPYWEPTETGAKCELTGEVSEEGNWSSLLWDQIKTCDIDDDYDEPYDFEDMCMSSADLEKRIKFKPTQALVLEIVNSPKLEVTIDGIQYTVSHHILDQFRFNFGE
jgi:hypothetical protein